MASDIRITGPATLRGVLRVPGDKSISHRALILAALADGCSTIHGLSQGEDVRRTAACVAELGAELDAGSDAVRVTGGDLREPEAVLDIGNAGTGIRLLAGLAATIPGLTVLQGDRSIAHRPMDRIAVPLRRMGARIDGRAGGCYPPLVIRGGGLRGITWELPLASAQVKSALLLAGLAAEGETVVAEPQQSRAHTEEMLAAFGADICRLDERTVRVRPSAPKPFELEVPGDPSQAAFWICAAAGIPGSDVTIPGIYLGLARTGFLTALERMGADIDIDRAAGTVHVRGSQLRATDIAPEEIPTLIDEVPALAVAAALAHGTTRVRGAAELRVKESDRIATTAAMLHALGGQVDVLPDGLDIHGPSQLTAGRIDAHGDHRIAMAGAVAALAARGDTLLTGFGAVETSYPGFQADLRRLTQQS